MNNNDAKNVFMDEHVSFWVEKQGDKGLIFKWHERNENDVVEVFDHLSTSAGNTQSSVRSNATDLPTHLKHSCSKNSNNIEVIWLDSNANNNDDCLDTQARLDTLIQSSQVFLDSDECVDYIVSSDDRAVFLVTSGSLGRILVPLIHNTDQIIGIYVYCANVGTHIQWAQRYVKIYGIFNEKNTLFTKLIQDLESFDTSFDTFSMSGMIDTKKETSIKDLRAKEQSIVWYQLIIEALLRLEDTSDEKAEMVAECRKHYVNDEIECLKICDFENNFTPNDAIRWYTRDSFLYRLFNKAMRTQDVPFIYKFRFFLKALYNQLARVYNCETIHAQPIKEVYRGQMIRIEELQRLKDNVGYAVSFHSFLSATRDKQVAAIFSGNGKGRPFFESVVFCIKILGDFHPYIETNLRVMNSAGIDGKPFADITNYATYGGEQEILFAMGSVFKVLSIKLVDNIWYAKCNFYSGGIGNFLRYEFRSWNVLLGYNPRMDVIGDFLLQLNNYADAITFYISSAKDQSDHLAVAWANYKLGRLYMRKGEYQTALDYLQKAENLMLLHVDITDFWLKNVFETTGDTYMRRAQQQSDPKSDYEYAIVNYKKALNTVIKKKDNGVKQNPLEFQATKVILGSSNEEVMQAEISYKIFKAYCQMNNHADSEYFREVFLTTLLSNSIYSYEQSKINTHEVFTAGVDSRTADTVAIRQRLFSHVSYIVEGAVVPNHLEMYKRCTELIRLAIEEEKKLILCKFLSDMCSPFYPNPYDILIFYHKYNLFSGSKYENDYSQYIIHQKNILNADCSNAPSGFSLYMRLSLTDFYLDTTLEKRLASEELDQIFLIQMMDFHSALWIQRRDLLNISNGSCFDYQEKFVLARYYSYYENPPTSIGDAYQRLRMYESQLKLLITMDLTKAALANPYRNIARIYSYLYEYAMALENYEKCLEIVHTHMSPNVSFLRRTYALIAHEIVELYLNTNAVAHARDLMKLWLNFAHKYAVSDHVQLAAVYSRLIDICMRQEDYDLCLEYAEQELMHLQSVQQPENERIMECKEKLESFRKQRST
ncbi:unnamed protein product [Adineta ricciae]|uniref:NAD(P)(+)--arginine ADP-ribosyltransferase n=1 Tax=Adineta ricciae TaxID=249248 RepID=A0A815WGE9_ADIRI|nr:unnamed protein product [Adineta ricciae]